MDRDKMMKRLNSVWTWAKKPVAGVPRCGWAVLATVVLVLIALFWDWIWCWLRDSVWSWLRKELDGNDLSNLTVILGAIIGISLVFWRSTTAHRQANVAQRGLQNERFQKGAEMLGSDRLATRISGIYAFGHLAREHPGEYHIQIMDVLCAFVRHPEVRDIKTKGKAQEDATNYPSPDVQAVLTVIRRRNQEQIDLEKKEERPLDLSGAHLEYANLLGVHLESADLISAHLDNAILERAHLEKAFLVKAHLQGAHMDCAHLNNAILMSANLEGADLISAHLENANLTSANLKDALLQGAYFEGANLKDTQMQNASLLCAKGLTQTMLDKATHLDEEGRLLPGPDLTEALCAESGERLVWRTPPDSS